jgi:urease accessory protein
VSAPGLRLVRLLQLASPALPVGAYSYSQGLEAAVEAGLVRDAPSAAAWIGEVFALGVRSMEAPLFARIAAAWERGDGEAAARWNAELVASRETAELRAETLQMGASLRTLLRDLGVEGAAALDAIDELAYATAFAWAAIAWRIDPQDALAAYLFAWLENQVLAAVKSVPLGQTQAQRMLLGLAAGIPEALAHAGTVPEAELSNFAPGLALLSSRHETQYSRLFRS